jgi:hypothetical protein
LDTLLCSIGWVGLIGLFDARAQPTAEAPTPYLKKREEENNLLI